MSDDTVLLKEYALKISGNFYATKESVRKIKRQATDQKKIFANYIPDKGLVFEIYK